MEQLTHHQLELVVQEDQEVLVVLIHQAVLLAEQVIHLPLVPHKEILVELVITIHQTTQVEVVEQPQQVLMLVHQMVVQEVQVPQHKL